MTVKTTGRLFNEFYNDNEFWPEDACLDDYYVKVNGVDLTMDLNGNFKDEDEIIIESGAVMFGDHTKQLDAYFAEWLGKKYPQNFSGAELDVIFKLVKFGPCAPGDLPSKSGAASLVDRKLVVTISGPRAELWYAASLNLIAIFKDRFSGRLV